MLVIGLDAAAQLDRCGYAIGNRQGSTIVIEEAGLLGGTRKGVQVRSTSMLADRIRHAPMSIVAIDAPLGWPQAMALHLPRHRAGEPLLAPRDRFFKRLTDMRVKVETGKTPLEVGAEKLAHAAHHALQLLGQLRSESERPIPLARAPDDGPCVAIEVYPAGTLSGHGLPSSGYKKEKAEDGGALHIRDSLAAKLEPRLAGLSRYCQGPVDVFDACICLLSALDFLERQCAAPSVADWPVAEREGWIWVRSRGC